MTSPRDNHEMIEATQIGAEQGAEPMKITRAQLMMVIRQRVEELTNEIEAALKGLGFTGPVGRQVVLTGGGAELKNIADYMQGVLGRAVRVGRPEADHRPARRAQRPGLLDPGRPRLARRRRAAATSATSRPPVHAPSRGKGMIGRLIVGDEGRLLAPASRVGGRGAWLHGDDSAESDALPALLIFLLGAAVFLNYVDRGAIAVAAPLMKAELGLSATPFGIAVSAFFWVYAPVQLFVGWLCDRFSVYKLMAGGHRAVGGEHAC